MNSYLARQRASNALSIVPSFTKISAIQLKSFHSQVPLQKSPTLKGLIEEKGLKRPTAIFMLYYKDVKQQVIEKHPDLKLTEVSKVVGEMWRSLAPDLKKKYKDTHDAQQAIYESQKADLMKTLPEKRPPNSFITFLGEVRGKIKEESPDLTLIEVTKKAGELWRALDEEERQSRRDDASKKLAAWKERVGKQE